MSAAKRGVIVSVASETRDLMRARSAETGITFPDLALDAVEDQATRLPAYYAAQAPAQRPGKIFARSAYQGQRGTSREGEVTINLQLLNADIHILDKMWREAGAPSRSHYVATALRLYLRPGAEEGAT